MICRECSVALEQDTNWHNSYAIRKPPNFVCKTCDKEYKLARKRRIRNDPAYAAEIARDNEHSKAWHKRNNYQYRKIRYKVAELNEIIRLAMQTGDPDEVTKSVVNYIDELQKSKMYEKPN